MAKPTGFLEFNRNLPAIRPVQERLQDYKEIESLYPADELNRQSARCMDCGVPFCQQGCPLGNIIPEFNDAVYRKDWLDAYHILSATNNFPEFTGRICPAPCESACVLGINQPAVTIEEIEKHIIEIAFEKGYVQAKVPTVRTGKKVAVVGSGPAGMAAAAQLNCAGHLVTVFERDDKPGGLLRYGIPDFKLEKWVIDRRIKLMEDSGIRFICNTNIGVHIKVNDLLRDYHAVVLAGGSTVPRDLKMPGRELKGIYYAMEFLTQQNKELAGEWVEDKISAAGKHVVVIGAGDTGSDCVGTANRQGALSVTQLSLPSKPSDTRPYHTPWPLFPTVLKTTSSHEEGVVRHWAVNTKAFVGDEQGGLKALQVTEVRWVTDAEGRRLHYEEVPGSEQEIPCDLALLALGYLHPQHDGMVNSLGVEKDNRGNIKASEKDFQTSLPKVFAIGDMRRGQSLVVWAISEGRECARKVDEFLMNRPSLLESKDDNLAERAWTMV
jgi:glutamate synthase (NADPH) small chain